MAHHDQGIDDEARCARCACGHLCAGVMRERISTEILRFNSAMPAGSNSERRICLGCWARLQVDSTERDRLGTGRERAPQWVERRFPAWGGLILLRVLDGVRWV